MSLPFVLKLGGEHLPLTRLVQYVVIQVEKPLQGRRLADSKAISREYSIWSAHVKPAWQLVVGKRPCKGICAELSSEAGRFPLQCGNRFAALDREMSLDYEELHSATSDVEQTSAVRCEVVLRSSSRKVCGVPKQLLGDTRVTSFDSNNWAYPGAADIGLRTTGRTGERHRKGCVHPLRMTKSGLLMSSALQPSLREIPFCARSRNSSLSTASGQEDLPSSSTELDLQSNDLFATTGAN
eukprot:6463876-Amphidinium_carterae.1